MAISLESLTDPTALANMALPLVVNVLAALLIFFVGKWLARKIIDAHAEAAKAGKGLVVVDGKLVENLHVEDAKRVLALADAITAGSI